MNIWQFLHLRNRTCIYLGLSCNNSIYCASVWSVQPSPLTSHLPDHFYMLLMAKEKSYLCSLCRNKCWWWLKTSRHEVCVQKTTSFTFQPERDRQLWSIWCKSKGVFHPGIFNATVIIFSIQYFYKLDSLNVSKQYYCNLQDLHVTNNKFSPVNSKIQD